MPFETASTVVLIIQDGAGWVRDAAGHRHEVAAPAVVVWEPGERVAYGSDAESGWTTLDYWGPRENEDGFHPTT